MNFKIEQAGLLVNPLYPHLGQMDLYQASAVVRVCPYSIQDSEGGIKLSTTHANYYYQIQGQLPICDRPYCDFVCCTTCGMHLKRITRDPIMWDEIQPKLDLFYVKLILCSNATSIVDDTSCSV